MDPFLNPNLTKQLQNTITKIINGQRITECQKNLKQFRTNPNYGLMLCSSLSQKLNNNQKILIILQLRKLQKLQNQQCWRILKELYYKQNDKISNLIGLICKKHHHSVYVQNSGMILLQQVNFEELGDYQINRYLVLVQYFIKQVVIGVGVGVGVDGKIQNNNNNNKEYKQTSHHLILIILKGLEKLLQMNMFIQHTVIIQFALTLVIQLKQHIQHIKQIQQIQMQKLNNKNNQHHQQQQQTFNQNKWQNILFEILKNHKQSSLIKILVKILSNKLFKYKEKFDKQIFTNNTTNDNISTNDNNITTNNTNINFNKQILIKSIIKQSIQDCLVNTSNTFQLQSNNFYYDCLVMINQYFVSAQQMYQVKKSLSKQILEIFCKYLDRYFNKMSFQMVFQYQNCEKEQISGDGVFGNKKQKQYQQQIGQIKQQYRQQKQQKQQQRQSNQKQQQNQRQRKRYCILYNILKGQSQQSLKSYFNNYTAIKMLQFTLMIPQIVSNKNKSTATATAATLTTTLTTTTTYLTEVCYQIVQALQNQISCIGFVKQRKTLLLIVLSYIVKFRNTFDIQFQLQICSMLDILAYKCDTIAEVCYQILDLYTDQLAFVQTAELGTFLQLSLYRLNQNEWVHTSKNYGYVLKIIPQIQIAYYGNQSHLGKQILNMFKNLIRLLTQQKFDYEILHRFNDCLSFVLECNNHAISNLVRVGISYPQWFKIIQLNFQQEILTESFADLFFYFCQMQGNYLAFMNDKDGYDFWKYCESQQLWFYIKVYLKFIDGNCQFMTSSEEQKRLNNLRMNIWHRFASENDQTQREKIDQLFDRFQKYFKQLQIQSYRQQQIVLSSRKFLDCSKVQVINQKMELD